MADTTTALAAVLGVALGAFMLAYPDLLVRLHTAGRYRTGRGGEYGSEGDVPERWRRLVRVLGVASLVLGGYFAWQVLLA